MDFEDFAQQFRKRAAERLTEFEKTLEKAQRDLEKSAERAAAQAKQQAQTQQQGTFGPQGQSEQRQSNRPLDYRTPDIPGVEKPQRKQQTPTPITAPGEMKPAQAKPVPGKPGLGKPGQIKSVLRRG